MLITPQTARDLLADLTQACAIPVDPEELTHCRFAGHGHIFVGDIPVRGYKHKGRWRLDDREVRRAGHALAQLPFDPNDLVDVKLPVHRPYSDESSANDWRRSLLSWMTHAAFKETWDNGCPCGPRTVEGRGCRRRGELQGNGLPCGLTTAQFNQRFGWRTIVGTRPLDVLSWSQAKKKWLAPRAYVDLLDRWAAAEDQMDMKARRCSGCGKIGDAWGWRTPTPNGWVTLCPACTASSYQKYTGHLRGKRYDSLPRTTRADDYLCHLCTQPRRASHWDHCHDHGYLRGPLCGGCNTHEGIGTNFLFAKAGLAHLLECRGCRQQRTLPRRHHEDVARRHLQTSERHDTCPRSPNVLEATHGADGAMRFMLVCFGHPQQTKWERELSGPAVTELVREFVNCSLMAANE